jgi:hypothetical protein
MKVLTIRGDVVSVAASVGALAAPNEGADVAGTMRRWQFPPTSDHSGLCGQLDTSVPSLPAGLH